MLLSLLPGFYSTSQEADVLAGLLSCSQVSLSAGTPKVGGEGGKVRGENFAVCSQAGTCNITGQEQKT